MPKYRPIPHSRGKRMLPSLGIFMLLLCMLLLVLSLGQPPAYDSIPHADQQLTLSTVTDFPLMGYASLSFTGGGGLYRLYDRSRLDLLEPGQTYDLTVGFPRGSSRRQAIHPNYTAVIAMTAQDGTPITTADDYQAYSSSPLFQLLSVGLFIMVIGILGYIVFILLRAVLLFIR